jgi:hypothetical protein
MQGTGDIAASDLKEVKNVSSLLLPCIMVIDYCVTDK